MLSRKAIAVSAALFVTLALFFSVALSGPGSRFIDAGTDKLEWLKQYTGSWTSSAEDGAADTNLESCPVCAECPTATAGPATTCPAAVTTTVTATAPALATGGSQAAKVVDPRAPPSTGCEDVVSRLQLRLIEVYSEMLRGIRYANIWGYLETENKGDAAIWTAQQMLLSQLGIETGESCRYLDAEKCDVDRFNATLAAHHPHSAIIMAGGGNFNDYYWDDQPSRLKMARAYPDVPLRAFPQSVHMTHDEHILETQDAFGAHGDLILSARDYPSWRWLDANLDKARGVPSVLVPDIALMWGNRPDFRLNTPKAYDILILARDDMEIAAADSRDIPFGAGFLDLGPELGNVSYNKVDWKFTHTPGIDVELPSYLSGHVQDVPSPRPSEEAEGDTTAAGASVAEAFEGADGLPTDEMLFSKHRFGTAAQQARASDLMYDESAPVTETSKNARAWAKAVAGFQLLGSAKFVITDRLHGHIMSTVIGVPHVFMDSKLGKNLDFHNTWTRGCDCVRVTQNFTHALDVARRYFELNGL